MKSLISKKCLLFVLVILFGIFANTTNAGIGQRPVSPDNGNAYGGTWHDAANESVIFINVDGDSGFWDIAGKDKGSMYECTCIADNGKIECVGDGVNHLSGKRFLYKSTLKIEKDGSISENWECFFKGQVISGKAHFRRKTGMR